MLLAAAVAVAVWVASPAAEELADPIGKRYDVPKERLFIGLDAYKKALACDVDLAILATPPGFRPGPW